MSDLIREAPIGQLIRYFTRNRYFQYPEEEPDFQPPSYYGPSPNIAPKTLSPDPSSRETTSPDTPSTHSLEAIESPLPPAEKLESRRSLGGDLEKVASRLALQKSETRHDLEQAFTNATLEKGATRPIEPEKLDDGTILVDWYDTDDPANPQNWSLAKKNIASAQI